eukprot:CAMPEP_0185763678 /NCGR_PEP_ID=MMETSP1174-20130828/22587_1 /TAXON_ID=35687 /ORGANISM="Dictyocha speculum, Strain CCMP1381" /LENGTH=51 /DNA_ID=CAMNT_0028445887 /DNA_START=701 /DNA_END=853 /DNA_ORIENTATION=-
MAAQILEGLQSCKVPVEHSCGGRSDWSEGRTRGEGGPDEGLALLEQWCRGW